MTINNDWLVRSVFDSLVEALDNLMKLVKENDLLSDDSFNQWIDNLYNLIYKYND